jgi:hypothetical protein
MCFRRLVAILLPGVVLVAAVGLLRADEKCATYHEQRVAYLLGCCGDLSVVPPGPLFPGNLDARQRATLAIKEASLSRKVCTEKGTPEYLSLILDMAGAYLMRANATTYTAKADTRTDSLRTAASDAASALQILLAFNREHPSESFRSWKWIATALNQAGSPWEALLFLSRLPPEYAEQGERRRFEGDLFFRLGMEGAASSAYAEWLSASNVDQCALESFAHAALLENSGFRLPQHQRSENVLCETQSFHYYFFVHPARKAGERAR